MPEQPIKAAETQPEPSTRRWAVLALLGVAQLMVVLDVTIVNVALPSAQRALGFSPDSRQWVVTAYALAFESLLLLGGKLGDLFGRKWTFVAGLIGFAGLRSLAGSLRAGAAGRDVRRIVQRRSGSSARSPALVARSDCFSVGHCHRRPPGAGAFS